MRSDNKDSIDLLSNYLATMCCDTVHTVQYQAHLLAPPSILVQVLQQPSDSLTKGQVQCEGIYTHSR